MINDHEITPIVFLKHCQLPKNKKFSDNTYDIIFITTGKCEIAYNSTELIYSTGSICLIPLYTDYFIKAVESGSMIHMGINPRFIKENLPSCDILICDSVREPNNNYRIIKELVSVISSKYLDNPHKNRLAIHGNMYRMLSLFEEKYSYSPIHSDIPSRYSNRVQSILKYLNEHYTEPITLEDVAEELFLTPQYLSRFFKNCFHKNFKDYLSEKRLFHAHREICFTDKAMDFLYRHNLIPFIELSKLPYSAKSFSKLKSKYVDRNQQFFDLLDAVITYIGRFYSSEWTSLWKFELWYNPSDTEETYTNDFKRIKSILHTNIPGASLGG